MSKKQQKEKQKAKQEFLELRQQQNVGVDEAAAQGDVDAVVDQLMDSGVSMPTFKETVSGTIRDAKNGKDVDERLLYLIRDYRNFRTLAITLAVVAFGMILVSMGLYATGMIEEGQQNFIIILANFVAVAMLIIVFVRVSPPKKDIEDWIEQRNYVAQRRYEARQAGRSVDTVADVDLDEFFDKSSSRRNRNKRNPPWPEFRRVHAVWQALIVAAGVLMMVAVVLANRNMNDVTNAVIILIVSYVLLFVSMVIDRTRLKPMRKRYEEEQEKRASRNKRAQKRAARTS